MAEVARLTDGRGVDVVYDGVGRTTFDASLRVLVPRGMMVLFGASSGPVPPFDPQRLNQGGSLFLIRSSLAHYILTREELLARSDAVLGQVAAGQLDVRVGGRYSPGRGEPCPRGSGRSALTGKLLIIPTL